MASAIWVALNLIVGFLLLLPVALLHRLLPFAATRRLCAGVIASIYRSAVRINSFWMKRVVGIKLVIQGDARIPDNAVILCNHQSWFDIPLIQEIVSSNGPPVKFLIKQELVWVPIIGWICLALDLPRIQRSKRSDTRKSDVATILRASRHIESQPGVLLVFPEGTRFTQHKRKIFGSPYTNLLYPKARGFAAIGEHRSADDDLVDITIDYHKPGVRIWDCLHGDPGLITITISHHKFGEVDDPATWLASRWEYKDQLLANSATAPRPNTRLNSPQV